MLFKARTIRISMAIVAALALSAIVIINSRLWLSYEELTEVVSSERQILSPGKISRSSSVSEMDAELDNFHSHTNSNNSSQSYAPTVGPPSSKPKNCRERHCKEYLNEAELSAMKHCFRETAMRTVNEKLNLVKSVIKENDCNFMNGSNRKPVALVSTEGSGNTWARGLLEKITGICTGFIYCDYVMRREGFIGEMIKSGTVLVVKTHTTDPQWYGIEYTHPKRNEPYYGSAIYIVRNPYNSLIAEWNRRATNGIIKKKHLPHNESHTNVVPKEYWGMFYYCTIFTLLYVFTAYLTTSVGLLILHCVTCNTPLCTHVRYQQP